MTDALTKWALEKAGKKWPPSHIDQQADYWIRVFVVAVEKRSKQYDGVGIEIGIEDALEELKRELLEGK